MLVFFLDFSLHHYKCVYVYVLYIHNSSDFLCTIKGLFNSTEFVEKIIEKSN